MTYVKVWMVEILSSMYMDYAKLQAVRGKAMTIQDWIKKFSIEQNPTYCHALLWHIK